MDHEFNNLISEHLGKGHISFFWKGRVALFCLLKAIGIKEGDEVILQGFTCVVVANAIIYLGARPIYADIDETTFNTTPQKIHPLITNRTKAIICQNTYGLSCDVAAILEMAKSKNIYVIEDCTHGFGGLTNGKKNGTIADAAFFSTQWNKPFSTGIGGFSFTQNTEIASNIIKYRRDLQAPSWNEKASLSAQYVLKKFLLNDHTYWPAVEIYRAASQRNMILGSSSGEEIYGTTLPKGYFKDMSAAQMQHGIEAIKCLPDLLDKRKRIGKIYTDLLMNLNKFCVNPELSVNHSFLFYPILVKDREAFLHAAREQRIRVGDWFLSPLHPVVGDLSQWQLNMDHLPVAAKLSSCVVTLPTTTLHEDKVIDFIIEHQNHLI